MAIERPCPEHVVCPAIVGPAGSGYFPDPDSPFTNLSSEAPDPVDFLFMYFYGNNPPINAPPNWWNPSPVVPGFGSGPTPKQAEFAAQRNAVDNALTPNNRPTFGNNAQSCTAICPDGTEFDHTVEANRITEASQAQADALAASYCFEEAEDLKVCILTASLPNVCVDHDYYSQCVNASGGTPTITGNAYFWEITSGILPPGLNLNPSNGCINGFPTTGGEYTFILKATDGVGTSASREFTIKVGEITTASTLESGAAGWEYVGATLASSIVGGTWSISAGNLPNGLTLDPSGAISGTPDMSITTQTFNFDAQVTDGDITCSKSFSIKIWTNDDTTSGPYNLGIDSLSLAPVTASFGTHGPGRFRLEFDPTWISGSQYGAQFYHSGPVCAPQYNIAWAGNGQGNCPGMPQSQLLPVGPIPGATVKDDSMAVAIATLDPILTTINTHPMEFDLSSSTALTGYTGVKPTNACSGCNDANFANGTGVNYILRRIGQP